MFLDLSTKKGLKRADRNFDDYYDRIAAIYICSRYYPRIQAGLVSLSYEDLQG